MANSPVNPLSPRKSTIATIALRITVNISGQDSNTVTNLRWTGYLFLDHRQYFLREIGRTIKTVAVSPSKIYFTIPTRTPLGLFSSLNPNMISISIIDVSFCKGGGIVPSYEGITLVRGSWSHRH
jgi:hypothetical protein